MFDSIAQTFIAIILIGGILAVTIRWVISKVTGKELVSGDADILGNLRKKIVDAFANNEYLIELEKSAGRQAVLDEIEIQINEFIDDTESLSVTEKDLLTSLDKTKLIEYIEQKLIELQVLKPQ